MPADKRIYSSDEFPVSQRSQESSEGYAATESLSTTKKIMKTATENRVLITVWITLISFMGIQLLGARDSTQQQPLVDKHQDFRIGLNTTNIDKIDGKLDEILKRLPKE